MSRSVIRRAAGLGLASASLMLLEISATRLMSFVSWYHFAFMVVSVAMLGLGAAAVVLALWRRLQRIELDRLAAVAGLAMAAAVAVAYTVVTVSRFSPPMLAADNAAFWRLGATYLGLLLPFLAGGMLMATVLTGCAEQAAVVYGGDLVGAGLGCLAGIALAGPLDLQHAFLVSGCGAALAAAVFLWPVRRWRPAGLALAAGLAAACWLLGNALVPTAAPGKELHALLEDVRPRGELLQTANTPLGRIDLVAAEPRVVWSRNPRVQAEVPPHRHILIDGAASTPVALIGARDPTELDYLDALPASFALAVRRPERVLVIGAGGGQDVLAALRWGARQIDAVEINPVIVDWMTGILLADSGGLYRRREVRPIVAEGRSFARSAPGQYDAIVLGLVDTWAASSGGGLSLTENYLYTVEAFEDYLQALRPGGLISVSRWLHSPPRETLRLAGLAREALVARGVPEPERHLAVVGAGRVGALLVRAEPFSAADVQRLVELARELQLDVLWLAGLPWPEDYPYRRLLAGDDPDYAWTYPYDITPVTDDNPFFFDFHAREASGWLDWFSDPQHVALSGSATVRAVLVQGLVLSLLLLGLPLVLRRVRLGRDGARLLAFFGLGGAGFLFVEIPMVQRLALVVGHPVQAVALVLGGMLLASGLGAWSGQRWIRLRRDRIRQVLLLLALLVAVHAALGAAIARGCLDAPAWARPLLVVLLVAPPGWLMGMLTPHGLACAARRRADLVPMLWAGSSFASVLGSILAVGLAIASGFSLALAAGAACYLLAAAVAPGE